jgi:hypothetical protein
MNRLLLALIIMSSPVVAFAEQGGSGLTDVTVQQTEFAEDPNDGNVVRSVVVGSPGNSSGSSSGGSYGVPGSYVSSGSSGPLSKTGDSTSWFPFACFALAGASLVAFSVGILVRGRDSYE